MPSLSIPYAFSPSTTALSAQVNTNFTEVQTSVNNVDNSQVGALGFFASQIIPTNGTNATFGGAQVYTFNNGVTVAGGVNITNGGATITGNVTISGTLLASSNGSTMGGVPPAYTPTGSGAAGTVHMVVSAATISVSNSATTATTTVSLSGASVYTASSSYIVVVSFASSPSFPSGWSIGTTGIFVTYGAASFTIELVSSTPSTGSGSVNIGYIVLGS